MIDFYRQLDDDYEGINIHDLLAVAKYGMPLPECRYIPPSLVRHNVQWLRLWWGRRNYA